MDVPEPEELTESPDEDKKFRRDSYLSPTFLSHAENCTLGQHLTMNRQSHSLLARALGLRPKVQRRMSRTRVSFAPRHCHWQCCATDPIAPASLSRTRRNREIAGRPTKHVRGRGGLR